MLILKQVIQRHHLKQTSLAKHLSLSCAAVSQLVNHGVYPRTIDKKELQAACYKWLNDQGIAINDGLFEAVTESANSQLPIATSPTEDYDMLLKKQQLKQATKKAFGITGDPFRDPINSKDLFLSPEMYEIREALKASINYPTFIAVIGESGSGKSTLRKELKYNIANSGESVIVIEPYVLAMEDNDIKGKTLKSAQLAEAILNKVAPNAQLKRGTEAKFRQIHQALNESAKVGNKHVLIIEEAHSLPIPTLKHLKRFFELEAEDGYSRLLSIVLIGQPELGLKLSEADPFVREVVQRCETVDLLPLGNALPDYLAHCFGRVNKKLSDIMEDEAIAALHHRLTRHNRTSMVYPLAVNNMVIAALNLAVALGESDAQGKTKVTAAVIENAGRVQSL